MNPAAPLLALLSAACWGTGDFFGGLASRVGGLRPTLVLSQAFGVLFALALLMLAGEAMPTTLGFAWAIAAGSAGLVGVGCLYLALSGGTMGIVAPATGLIAATIPALVGIAGGEAAGPVLLAGMAIALAAVVVISWPESVPGPRRDMRSGRSPTAEWLLIVASGMGFAAFYVLADLAHEAGSGTVWTLVGVRMASTALALLLMAVTVVARRSTGFPVGRRVVGMAALTGLGDTGGNLFYIASTAVGALSVTVVLASLYPVSTALWARVVLRERLSPMRVLGVALAVIGALLVSAGSLAG